MSEVRSIEPFDYLWGGIQDSRKWAKTRNLRELAVDLEDARQRLVSNKGHRNYDLAVMDVICERLVALAAAIETTRPPTPEEVVGLDLE